MNFCNANTILKFVVENKAFNFEIYEDICMRQSFQFWKPKDVDCNVLGTIIVVNFMTLHLLDDIVKLHYETSMSHHENPFIFPILSLQMLFNQKL